MAGALLRAFSGGAIPHLLVLRSVMSKMSSFENFWDWVQHEKPDPAAMGKRGEAALRPSEWDIVLDAANYIYFARQWPKQHVARRMREFVYETYPDVLRTLSLQLWASVEEMKGKLTQG